jgi:hypothetical protein
MVGTATLAEVPAVDVDVDVLVSRPLHVDTSVATTTRTAAAFKIFILPAPKNAGRRTSPARKILTLWN